MALLRLMNFDRSTVASDFSSDYASITGNPIISAGGSFGSNTCSFSDSEHKLVQVHAPIPEGTVGLLGIRVKNTTTGDGGGYTSAMYGVCDPNGMMHLIVIISNNGRITVVQGSGTHLSNGYSQYYGATLFTGPIGQMAANTLNYLQMSYTISATIGTLKLLLNGVTVCALTYINTKNTSSSSTTTTQGYGIGGMGSFQDIYVADGTGPAPNNTFLGDLRVHLAKPTGNGTLTQFTPVGGATNWQVAATSPMVPATIYNTANTVGSTDLYTAAPLPVGMTTIFGVQVEAQIIKSDAGPRTAAMQIKSGAAVATGASHPLSVSVANYTDLFTVDPATGAAFTVAGVNALQFGPTILT